ncbi:hypothetical protein HRbin19_01376 [bacterium HR19]|nr:hypothetical protein HRbin19_01376 [bacterium HR19]
MNYEKFRKIARAYAVSHLIAGTLYIPFHKIIPQICNFIGDVLPFHFQPLPLPSEMFWFALSVSMMYMIAYSGYIASKSEDFVYAWKVIILSKGTSTFLFFAFFIADKPAFAYIAGIIVDGPLFLIALISWKKYISEKDKVKR